MKFFRYYVLNIVAVVLLSCVAIRFFLLENWVFGCLELLLVALNLPFAHRGYLRWKADRGEL